MNDDFRPLPLLLTFSLVNKLIEGLGWHEKSLYMCQVSEVNTHFSSQTLSPTNYQAFSREKLTKIHIATPLQATHLTRFARRTVRKNFAIL